MLSRNDVQQLVGVLGLILVVESLPAWALTVGGVLFWQAGWLNQIAESFWQKREEQTGKLKQCQSAFQGAWGEEPAQKSRQVPSALSDRPGEEPAKRSSWQRWRDRKKLQRNDSIVSSDAPIKESLVAKIKSFQRFDTEMKHAWWTFCESHGGNKRDPACYPVEVLQQFLQDQVPLKDSLVVKIKELQSSERGKKHAWWTFCESQEGRNRDPARYPVDVLQQFVQDHLCEEITLSQSSSDPYESRLPVFLLETPGTSNEK